MKPKHLFLSSVVILYAVVFLAFDNLRFPERFDEQTFWPASQTFADGITPTIHQLRNYNPSKGLIPTPLTFVIFGAIEHLFHGGIFAGRLLNYITSLLIISVISLKKNNTKAPMLSAVGLMCFPYFWATATHLYTDIIAAFFVLMGFLAMRRGQHILSGVSFILAVSSRQYMFVFPVALCIHTLIKTRKTGFSTKWIPYFIAAISLLGWLLFFGGYGPQIPFNSQIPVARIDRMIPQYGLYFLSCVGLYFVVPELILFKRLPYPTRSHYKRAGTAAALLLVLFALYPPAGNVDYPIQSMGLFDKSVTSLLGSIPRTAVLYVFALAAIIRFPKYNLASLLLYANTALMMKSYFVWDKYALPLIVVLWYLKSIDELD